jgi:hypothetical protein
MGPGSRAARLAGMAKKQLVPQLGTFAVSIWLFLLLGFACFHLSGRRAVDLTLRLNAIAVCAVFIFVGAIILGAF